MDDTDTITIMPGYITITSRNTYINDLMTDDKVPISLQWIQKG